MFRNVLERRRELALLRAVGYNARHVSLMIVAETALLLASGCWRAPPARCSRSLPRGSSAAARRAGLALLLAGVLDRRAVVGRRRDARRAERRDAAGAARGVIRRVSAATGGGPGLRR